MGVLQLRKLLTASERQSSKEYSVASLSSESSQAPEPTLITINITCDVCAADVCDYVAVGRCSGLSRSWQEVEGDVGRMIRGAIDSLDTLSEIGGGRVIDIHKSLGISVD
jgi:hypothetical protein